MKRFILFARHYVWFAFAVALPAQAQPANPYPHYVVIGAFAKHPNAINFTADAQKHNFPAKFEMNLNRNLYYVYVLTTSDRQQAVDQALKLRTETKYFDTWVYTGTFDRFLNGGDGFEAEDVNPLTGKKMQQVPGADEATASLPLKTRTDNSASGVVSNDIVSPGQSQPDPHPVVAAEEKPQRIVENKPGTVAVENATRAAEPDKKQTDSLLTVSDASVRQSEGVRALPPKRTSEAPLTTEEVVGKNFYFSLFRADNNAVVPGEVEAVDFERSRKMATYPANAPVTVIMPSGKSRRISFICQVFGYRKLQKEFDPASPSEELYLDEKGNVVMPFELVRLQKGDIAIMYNVFFYKDAAVMRPESRYEVNNLLDLLLENPRYTIRIHGHTNGNAAGKIIRMGKPDNFYSLTETKQGFGSAKKLSEERAEVIKQFLVSSGVSANRMEIKAWGGRRPLFDKNSVRAVENVRVEIEILSQ